MKDILKKENCESVIRILMYVMVFWLPYSLAVVEISVVLSLIFWAVKTFPEIHEKSGNVILRDPNRFMIGFFLIIGILSLLENSMPLSEFRRFLTKTVEWFVIYYLACDVFRDEKHFRFLLKVLFITTFATAVDALFQFYISHRDFFLGYTIVAGESPTAGFKTPNGLGAFIAAVIPLSILDGLKRKKTLMSWMVWGLFNILLVWVLVLTACRGAMVAVVMMVIFVAILFLFNSAFGGLKKKLAVLSGIMCFLVFSCLVFYKFSNTSTELKHASANWRVEIWKETIDLIKEQPLLGYGINEYMQQFQIFRRPFEDGRSTKHGPTYAHNCFIQICFETGLLGLFVFLWLIVKILKAGANNFYWFCRNHNDWAFLSLGFLASFFVMLVHSFFDNHFYSLQLSALFWLMAGLVMAVYLNRPAEGKDYNA